MKSFKIVVTLAIAGVAIWWGISSHQETEKQRAIINDVIHLVDTCKSMQGSGAIPIQGKTLVWDMTSNARSGAYSKLPPELRGTSSDTPITVFMVIGQRSVQVGRYSISGQPAYREYMDVCAAYWPAKKVAGMGSVVSKEPRSRRPVEHRPEYGDPNEPVANWIASLPKNGKS